MARPTLYRHRKFYRLCRSLGDDCRALGVLEFLWSAAYESGDDFLGSAEDVEVLAHWSGEAGGLVPALVDAGFLDPVEGGGFRVHDLYDHAPEYVKKRLDRELARRKAGRTLREMRAAAARTRWKKARRARKKEQTAANGTHVQPASLQTAANGTPPAPAPAPAPSEGGDAAPSSWPKSGGDATPAKGPAVDPPRQEPTRKGDASPSDPGHADQIRTDDQARASAQRYKYRLDERLRLEGASGVLLEDWKRVRCVGAYRRSGHAVFEARDRQHRQRLKEGIRELLGPVADELVIRLHRKATNGG